MKKIIFMTGMCLAAALQGCAARNDATSKDIVNEVRQIRAKNNHGDFNISSITKKYISSGQTKEDISEYLKSGGFDLYYYPATTKKPEILLASYNMKKFPDLFGRHEIRIIITIENDVAKNIDGILFYHPY
jgi:hypothetical protein